MKPQTPNKEAEVIRTLPVPSETETLILLSAPSATLPHYAKAFDKIIDFDTRFVGLASGSEKVVVLANKTTLGRIKKRIPQENLREGALGDIWIRDFAPIHTEKGFLKCRYTPSYMDKNEARSIERAFRRWYQEVGLEAKQLDLILDGGNFVYDGQRQAVLTERVLADNGAMSREEVIRLLHEESGLERIGFLPEEEGEETGHADGMVKWLSPGKIAVNTYEEPFRSQVLGRLEGAFPKVEIVEIPYQPTDEGTDARGIYVNALETAATLFVPTYGLEADQPALEIYRKHSHKRVVGIDASGVSPLGGSVHCLTWVLTGEEVGGIMRDLEGW